MRVRERQRYFRGLSTPRRGHPSCWIGRMAIYHFDLKAVSRKEGHSSVYSWAYATGTRQVDERTGRVYDFSARAQDILYRGQAGPVDWQAAERAERRWDAKVARTLIVGLPHELSLRAQINLVAAQANWLRESRGVAVTWAVHEAPGDPRNRHGHLVITTRRVDENGRHGKKTRELDVAKTSEAIVTRWRHRWQLLVNSSLAAAGSDARIDHRSVADTRPHPAGAAAPWGQNKPSRSARGTGRAAGRHNATVDEIERINAELTLVGRRIRYVLDLQRRARVKRQIRQARQRARWIPKVQVDALVSTSSAERTPATSIPAPQKSAVAIVKKLGRRR